jgi:hypothetical protein
MRHDSITKARKYESTKVRVRQFRVYTCDLEASTLRQPFTAAQAASFANHPDFDRFLAITRPLSCFRTFVLS